MRLVKIEKSSRPDKKYQAVFEAGDGALRKVHFGASGYGDFIAYSARSKELGKQKREAYIARHGATENWSRADTPATLARYVLWERPTLADAVREFRRRFAV